MLQHTSSEVTVAKYFCNLTAMFVTAVCFVFLLKLKWPKNKNIYECLQAWSSMTNYDSSSYEGIERFSIECRKTKTNYSAKHKEK